MFRSNYLGPRTHCAIGVGLVYMGFVLVYILTINQPLTSDEASVNFLDGTKIEQQRILLAVYPLLLVSCSSMLLLCLVFTPFQSILLHPCMDDFDSVMVF